MSPRVNNAILLVMGLALSVSLGFNVRLLRDRKAHSGSRAASGLAPGAAVSPFSARNVAGGQIETVAFDPERPTALYVFSPECKWCTKNADSIRSLASQRQEKYRFVGLSLSDTAQSGGARLPFPVYAGLGPEVRKAYQLGTIPQMIVVAPGGRVVKTWTGAFVGSVKSEIEQYFEVQLPG